MLGLMIIAFIVLVAILAGPFGVDSRDGFMDPHGPTHPVGIS